VTTKSGKIFGSKASSTRKSEIQKLAEIAKKVPNPAKRKYTALRETTPRNS
jgi:hypothetical protein